MGSPAKGRGETGDAGTRGGLPSCIAQPANPSPCLSCEYTPHILTRERAGDSRSKFPMMRWFRSPHRSSRVDGMNFRRGPPANASVMPGLPHAPAWVYWYRPWWLPRRRTWSSIHHTRDLQNCECCTSDRSFSISGFIPPRRSADRGSKRKGKHLGFMRRLHGHTAVRSKIPQTRE